MANLGRGEQELLLHLSDNGPQPLQVDGNRARVGNAETRTAMIDNLVNGGFAVRGAGADGAEQLEISDAGRAELERALAQKWVVDHSGLHEESGTYRFEVPDPVTGRRFIVAVQQSAGPQLANRVAYGVIAAPSVRESCRKLDAVGQDGGFAVDVALEGAGRVDIWRKL
jgi:hypothetical protein